MEGPTKRSRNERLTENGEESFSAEPASLRAPHDQASRTGRDEGGEQVLLSVYTTLQAMWAGLRTRMENEEGAVATEYVVLLVLIAIAIIAGASVLAGAINAKFECASSAISPISPGSC